MSVEFRQRTPSEYLRILQRRKWLIILPLVAITAAVVWVVVRLPDVYESSTLIVVKPSTLPTSMVPTVTDDSLTRQLTSISQVVTSRSSLEPLVVKYDLYKSERLRGEPMESIITMMRKDIKVEVNTSRNDITNGFNITFRNREPRITQAVTGELASKYIDQQTSSTSQISGSARQFIDNQVKQAKEELDRKDKERLDFMNQNLGSLPSEAQSLISQLSGLREQQKALMAEVGRLQDRRSASAGQLALLKQSNQTARTQAAEDVTDPKTTMAYSQLVTRKAALEGELTKLKQDYTPKHPDVIAKQAEIDKVQETMDQMVAEWKDKIKEKTERLDKMPDLTASAVEAEIRMTEGEIKRQQDILAQNDKAIGTITERINHFPGVEVQLGALERDYNTQKAAYDNLLAQQAKLALNDDAIKQQQGEGIQVIDAANLPSIPVAPKRLMLSVIGLAVGLGVGLLLAGVFEVPRLLTIQTTEDARHYTGLPVLMAVPELLTPQEARAVPRRRRLMLAAGVAVTIVSIPLLALALKLTHVFELLSQSSGRA
jgi:polysaccharide chain length determinant protein (PEP-CTERM system associated)